ncbi:MAG TPA: Gldg family protein [Polyangiaceae bacterium]|jgi:ABC-type uncharacterized transport system involved in gliding motility auxiliary subunit
MEKKVKAATESGVLILIIAAILVAVNALSALGMNKRIDTTKNEKFTLSKGSGNLLRSMKQNMKVDAYVTRGLPKLDAFVRDLRDLLQEYKEQSGGKFDYEVIEPKTEDEKKAAKDAGLVEQPFGEASDTEEKAAVAQGFMGLVLKYGSEKDAIKFIPPGENTGMEFWITNKIREIRDKGDNIKHKVGVLSGDDEIKLTDANLVPSQGGGQKGGPSIQSIISQAFPFYSFADVDLKGGENEIDEALDGLIITQPGKDLTEKELRRIDQFMMKGKSLAIFASSVNEKPNDATMNATLSAHGLDKLLEGYGITLNKDVVLDFGPGTFRVNMLTQGGIASVRFPDMLNVQDDTRFTGNETLLDTAFPGFFRLPEVVLPFASSVAIHADKQPEAKLSIIARSTPRSIVETGDTVDLRPLGRKWTPKGQWQQYGLAAQAEGILKSAFPTGDKMGVDAPEKSLKTSRIFLVSSSGFLTNPFVRAGQGVEMNQFGMNMPMGQDEELLRLAGPYAQQALTQTILAFKNTLDWISGDTDLLAVSAKILQDPNLVYGDVSKPNFSDNDSDEQLKKRDDEMKQARKSTQERVTWVLTLGIPLLFSLYGVLRWRMRDAARANVSLA